MSVFNPKFFWLLFWYRPAKAMQHLLNTQWGHPVALGLATFFGIIQCHRLFLDPFETMFWNVALYGFFSVLGVFLFAWLLRNFGTWFGACAQQRDIRTTLGFGLLPWTLLFTLLFWMLNSGLQPEVIAASYFPVFLCAFFYGFYIFLRSLSVALRLNIIKTLLCFLVTVLLSLFPITLLAQLLVRYLN